MNDATPFRTLTNFSGMIDHGPGRDCMPAHKKARQQARDYANARLEDEIAQRAASPAGLEKGDARRIALDIQQDTKARLGFALVIYCERDGRIHFGHRDPWAGEFVAPERADMLDVIPYRAPADEGIRLADVFKRRP